MEVHSSTEGLRELPRRERRSVKENYAEFFKVDLEDEEVENKNRRRAKKSAKKRSLETDWKDDKDEAKANGIKQSSANSDEVEENESLANGRKRKNRRSEENNSAHEERNASTIGKRCKTEQNHTEMGKRVRKKGENSFMCHQCQRNDKGRVVHCTVCKSKRFCVPCMTHWYPLLSEQEIAEKCPVCRGNCNCKGCLRKIKMLPEIELSREDKVMYGWRIVKYLYPWLKEFHDEQIAEKEIEAKIKGLDSRELELPRAKCGKDERMYCNKCQTSIVDFHRTCRNCAYDLCLVCCREFREYHSTTANGAVLGGDKVMLGAKVVVSVPGGEEVMSAIKSHVWTPRADGQIPCPPEKLGGCGNSALELQSVLGESFISQLFQKITQVASANPNFEEEDDEVIRKCKSSTKLGKLNLREAANRKDTGDNYLYCPLGREVKEGQLSHFQKHWMKGEPVIVRDVLELTSGLSWEPMVMWRALRETKYKDQVERLAVIAIDCRDWGFTEINTHKFFSGYETGLSHKDSWPLLLKLKDWPPASSFDERLPRHGAEFIAALPFKEYTDPRCGSLNLAVKLPEKMLKPDLGPKTYIAYGIREEIVEGDSVTKLHCDMSDAINILTHTSEVKLTAEQHKAIEKKHNKSKGDIKDCKTNGSDKPEEKIKAIDRGRNKKTKSKAIDRGRNKKTKTKSDDSEKEEYGGALWDIWRREDVPKLKDYLMKYSREFTHYGNNPVEQVDHPIHDQSFYLTVDHKRKLKDEYGIEAWTFEQKLGEAVFIPAGCPHQVRNLKSCIKVALDFVSPENFSQCIDLSNEFRLLPQGHRAKEDKLEVKKMAVYALKKAIDDIEGKKPEAQNKRKATDGSVSKKPKSRRKKTKRGKRANVKAEKEPDSQDREKATEEMEQAENKPKEEMKTENGKEPEKHNEEEITIDGGEKPEENGTGMGDEYKEETIEGVNGEEHSEILNKPKRRGRLPKAARTKENITEEKNLVEDATERKETSGKGKMENGSSKEGHEMLRKCQRPKETVKLEEKPVEKEVRKDIKGEGPREADAKRKRGRSKKVKEASDAKTEEKTMEEPMKRGRGRPRKVKIEKILPSEKEEKINGGNLEDQMNPAEKAAEVILKEVSETANEENSKETMEEPMKRRRGRPRKVKIEKSLPSEKEEKITGGNLEDQMNPAEKAAEVMLKEVSETANEENSKETCSSKVEEEKPEESPTSVDQSA